MLYLVVISPILWLVLTIPQIFLVAHDLDITKDQGVFCCCCFVIVECFSLQAYLLVIRLGPCALKPSKAFSFWNLERIPMERKGWRVVEGEFTVIAGSCETRSFPFWIFRCVPERKTTEVQRGLCNSRARGQQTSQSARTGNIQDITLIPIILHPPYRWNQGVEGALQIGSPSSRIGAQIRTYFEL